MSKFIPTDEQWEKMKRHIKGENYKKEDFFVFETLAVGDKVVPNRYMRLTPALLNVMKEDAEKGVSLMLNHNWSQTGVQSIPIGKVFDARIDGSSQNGEETTLYTTQYILRDDSKVDGYSKNDIIKLIESGILADTSVGWGTTRESYKCNICGNSIYDYRHCEHIPGKKYIVNEETNEVKECIIQAEPPKELHAGNNVLMENSIVFDGAYPNAIIQSAFGEEVETPTGKFKKLEGKQDLSEKDVILGYSTAGGNINLLYKETLEKGGKGKMEGNENVNELENQEIETNEENLTPTTEQTPESTPENNLSVETGTDTEANPETSGNEEMSVEKAILEKFDNICDTVDELVQMAKEGLENRNSVIAKALDSGVHSMGNAFDKNIFTKTFSNMKTKDIEQMGKVWEEQADNKFSKTKISKQEFANQEKNDEFKRVGLEQFKTSNY
ncbi:MAG: hypothetical protein MR691_08350 [Clostridium sp.]|nr:hypothetical protein [Clostridium sp.]